MAPTTLLLGPSLVQSVPRSHTLWKRLAEDDVAIPDIISNHFHLRIEIFTQFWSLQEYITGLLMVFTPFLQDYLLLSVGKAVMHIPSCLVHMALTLMISKNVNRIFGTVRRFFDSRHAVNYGPTVLSVIGLGVGGYLLQYEICFSHNLA